MTTHTTNDPQSVRTILEAAGINPADIQPAPGRQACDGIMSLGHGAWLIVSNNAGQFSVTAIEDATKKEAFTFLESLNGGKRGANARLVATGNEPPERN